MPFYLILDARTAPLHFPGIGRYVCSLAAALAPQLGPDEVLTLLRGPVSAPAPVHPRVPSITVSASPFGLRQQAAVPRLLLAASLYRSSDYQMPYRPGVPTVLTVYDLIPLHFSETVSLLARLLFTLATRLVLRATDRVITISEAARRDFLVYFAGCRHYSKSGWNMRSGKM